MHHKMDKSWSWESHVSVAFLYILGVKLNLRTTYLHEAQFIEYRSSTSIPSNQTNIKTIPIKSIHFTVALTLNATSTKSCHFNQRQTYISIENQLDFMVLNLFCCSSYVRVVWYCVVYQSLIMCAYFTTLIVLFSGHCFVGRQNVGCISVGIVRIM